MSDPVSALDAEALLRSLIQHEAEFVVIGGLAVAAHGYLRATKDVDVVPRPDRANLERLFGALEHLDARPIETEEFRAEEPPVPFSPEGLAQGGNWALHTIHGRIDLMQWVPGLDDYERLRANSMLVPVPNVGPVLFAGYDELVAMKRATGRDEDRLDIERLRDARGES